MKVRKLVSTGIILGIGLVCVGCQAPISASQQTQSASPGFSQKSPPRFIEEPDTDDFVADQLRHKATNFYKDKY